MKKSKDIDENIFHSIRKAFYIDDKIIMLPDNLEHYEYFKNINHVEYIDEKPRGYRLNDYVMVYQGKDFGMPICKIDELVDKIKNTFNDIKWIGLGCKVSSIGEIWEPMQIINI